MKKQEVIVAVSRGHNASTTLMVDGEIIFYLEEERLSRRKYDGCPLLGILEASKYVDHIDHLIVCHTHRTGPLTDWTGVDLYKGWAMKLFGLKPDDESMQVHFVDTIHHEMHAACGFLNSGFEEAACVIADGAGSFLQTQYAEGTSYEFETIFKGTWNDEGPQFETVWKHMGTRDSIGIIDVGTQGTEFHTEYPGITKAYEAVTEYCNFAAIDAGKMMGLSPYGRENENLPDFLNSNGWVSRELFLPNYPNGARINCNANPLLLQDIIDRNNAGEEWFQKVWTQTQKDMAYKMQRTSEEYMSNLINEAVGLTGTENVVICGGYGLNCVANYKFWEKFPQVKLHCEPVAHDGGISIGAAKLMHARLNEQKKPYPVQTSIYYGLQYDPATYEPALEGLEVSETTPDDVAKLIREGTIVTIFQGRSEGGPRALGNRSILFDPTIQDGKDIVNSIKRREYFRPFACSIKEEKVHEWFDLQGRERSPHMMYAVKCLPGVAKKIPSVIHVDDTCRIQTLTRDDNPHYYDLIDAFEKLSGCPILFNTSFNLGGDPLVERIEDAVKTLKESKIEYMYLPELNKLVKSPNPEEEE